MLEMSDEIQRSLGRVEGKLDSVIEKLDPIDRRLSKVEAKQHWFAGAGAAIGALIGLLVGHGGR